MVSPKTYNDIYLDLRRRFQAAQISGSELEAREIICFATGKGRSEFLRDKQMYASGETMARIEELADRRLRGEPVAYLIGEWEFYGLPMDVSRDVLVPRDDTEVLARRAIELTMAAQQPARVIDLCCGSGCVGVAVAHHAPQAKVVLCDISEDALRITRQNIRRNGVGAQAVTMSANALDVPPAALWACDVLVCNPPYITTEELDTLEDSVRLFEPRLALDGGDDGLDFYRSVAAKWKGNIKPGGSLLFEVGYTQAGQVEDILMKNGYQIGEALRDSGGHFRVVEGVNLSI